MKNTKKGKKKVLLRNPRRVWLICYHIYVSVGCSNDTASREIMQLFTDQVYLFPSDQ